MRLILISLLLVLCNRTLAFAEEKKPNWDFKSPEAKDAVKKYVRAIRKVNTIAEDTLDKREDKYEENVKKAREELTDKLDKAKIQETQKGNFEDAKKMQDAIKALQALRNPHFLEEKELQHKFQSRAARDAINEFNNNINALNRDAEDKLTLLEGQYKRKIQGTKGQLLADLKKAQQAVQQAGNLNAALKIATAIKALNGGAEPPRTPAFWKFRNEDADPGRPPSANGPNPPKTIDLLALVQLPQHCIRGKCEKNAKGEITLAAFNEWAGLLVPFAFPNEYTLRVQFSFPTMNLNTLVSDNTFQFPLDTQRNLDFWIRHDRRNTSQPVTQLDFNNPVRFPVVFGEANARPQFNNHPPMRRGKKFELTWKVSPDTVEVFLDGKPLPSLVDGKKIQKLNAHHLRGIARERPNDKQQGLGLSGWANDIVYHKIELSSMRQGK